MLFHHFRLSSFSRVALDTLSRKVVYLGFSIFVSSFSPGLLVCYIFQVRSVEFICSNFLWIFWQLFGKTQFLLQNFRLFPQHRRKLSQKTYFVNFDPRSFLRLHFFENSFHFPRMAKTVCKLRKILTELLCFHDFFQNFWPSKISLESYWIVSLSKVLRLVQDFPFAPSIHYISRIVSSKSLFLFYFSTFAKSSGFQYLDATFLPLTQATSTILFVNFELITA